jgi:hypothetical protein
VRQAAPRARATKRQHDFNPRKFQLFSLYAPAQLAAVTARTARASGELKRGARATASPDHKRRDQGQRRANPMVPQCVRGDGRAWISISLSVEAYVTSSSSSKAWTPRRDSVPQFRAFSGHRGESAARG